MDFLAQMGGGGGMAGGMMMMVVMVVFAVLLIAGIVWLVRSLIRRCDKPQTAAADDPLQVLGRRFARGEIDADEYEERRSTLRAWG